MLCRYFSVTLYKTWKTIQNYFVILILALAYELHCEENTTNDVIQNTCLSANCVKTASSILANINTSISPCDNFYEFACGSYIKKTVIPNDKSTVNIPHSIGDFLEAKVRTLLDDPSENDLRPFILARKFFKTCMNTAAIEKTSVKTLLKYIRKFGGWPVLDGEKWDKKKFHWQQLTYDLHAAGFGSSYLLRIYVFLDPKNSTRTILFIHQAMLGLKREYLTKGLSDKLVRAYFKYMVDVAVMLGAEEKYAMKHLKKSLKFEMSLAEISLPKEELRNFTTLYNPITIRDLQRKYPGISWFKYLTKLLNGTAVTKDEVVILQAPNYISGLLHLLKKTPKRMPIAVGALYIRKYFTKSAKEEAQDMVQNIRQQLRVVLEEATWMDTRTQKRALEKLSAMEAHVGYPDELLNDTLLEQYYEKLKIRENCYLESVLEITKFERLYEFRSLHSPVNKSSWVDHANSAVVNAFYTFSENSINLPAGILQEAFFASDRPRYLNYGAIGSVIGHEMIHGYDDKGRQYDKNGNLVDWWEEETSKNFVQRAKCFIDQYSSYRDKQVNMHLNGVNTQGENIADNGGVKVAYEAYQRWVRNKGAQEQGLPGLEYTPSQMFWLSMANAFCAKSRPEYTQLIITTDEHSPARFRVLGTLTNLRHFAEDFHCDASTIMNPRKKCTLW